MGRVLVIADEEFVRTMLRHLLVGAEYEVVEAPDGEEGMRLFRQDPTDVVITDTEMPKNDGLDVIQELICGFPDARIIAITGSQGGAAEVVRVNAGAIGAR